MSVRIDVAYQGELRCAATHAPSGETLVTDAPVDNHGKGESCSPTDLVATALGSCMLTLMGIFAARHGLELRGASVTVVKEMTATPPRQIARLTSEIRVPLPADHPHRAALERAALTCPVHASLREEIAKPVTFIWEG
jgi:putative redox protein